MDYNAKILECGVIDDGRTTLPRHATKKWGRRDPTKIKGVVYHQSLDEYGRASGNAKYHTQPNHISKTGLPGLSYTLFGERRGGRVILANDIEAKTYSQGYRDPENIDENALYIGVCWGGNFSAPGYEGTQSPTYSQMENLSVVWKHLKGIWGLSDDQLYGHYDFGKKTCPGDVITKFIRNIKCDEAERDFDTHDRQTALKDLGYYDGRIDGEWGPKSKAALIEFQRSIGIEVDGVWGKMTLAAVKTALR